MRHTIHTVTTLLVVATSVVAVSSCSAASKRSDQTGSANYASNATFTMAVTADPGVFNPYQSQALYTTVALAYDSLVNQQPNGEVVSGLAEKWTTAATSVSFTLRPGITCSDGTPLTASQVKADFDYLKNVKNGSPLYGSSVPATPFTVTADETARTVKFVSKTPFGFPLLTLGATPIMCAAGLKDPSILKSRSDGTGPFVLTEEVVGSQYTFAVREGYKWGPGGATTAAPGTPAKVIIKLIPNETTAANLLLSGGVNFAPISSANSSRLEARGLKSVGGDEVGAELWFNQQHNRPMADLRVRQALMSALDLAQVIKVSTNGKGAAATGLVTEAPKPCTGDTVSGQLPTYDVAKANTLLDQAGWAMGSNHVRSNAGKPLSINLHFYTAPPGNSPTAELIAQAWKAIGATVKLTGENLTGMNNTMFVTGNYDVFLDGFGFSSPTQVVPFVSGAVPPTGQNLIGNHNSDYERLAAQAAQLSGADACSAWNRAEQALYQEVAVAPISQQPVQNYLHKSEAQVLYGYNVIPTSIRVLS